jgi:hypothetical protein
MFSRASTPSGTGTTTKDWPMVPANSSSSRASRRAIFSRALAASPLLLALASLTAFGIVGIGRAGTICSDMHFLYTAGRCWAMGLSPYDVTTYLDMGRALGDLERIQLGFAYPPQSAPLCLLLSALPIAGAALLITLLNFVAIGALIHVSIALTDPSEQPFRRKDARSRWILPAVIAGNPFVTHIVWGGQTTLISAACLTAGWYFVQKRNRWLLGGVLLALSTLKPHVAVLPILWIVLERRWRPLAVVAATTLALMSIPLLVEGPLALLHHWYAAVQRYKVGPCQAIGFQNIFGIQSLLMASGINCPGLGAGAVAATVALFALRARWPAQHALGVLVSLSFLLIYAHDYDLAALGPLFASIWTQAKARAHGALAALGLFGLLFFPQRLLRASYSGAILHWRELVVLAALAWLLTSVTFRVARRGAGVAAKGTLLGGRS